MGAICSCIVVVIVMFKYQSDEIQSRQMLFKLMAYLCTMILVCSFIVNHTDHILKLKMVILFHCLLLIFVVLASG